MIATNGVRYVKSPCLRVVRWQDTSVTVAHQLSGRQFVLGKDAYSLLCALDAPQTLEALRARYPVLAPDALSSAMATLVERQLAREQDAADADETFQITGVSETLCFVNPFDPSVGQPQIVFLGIPYGGGNSVSQASARAPHVLRKTSRSNNVDLAVPRSFAGAGSVFDVDFDVDLSRLEHHVRGGALADWGNLYVYPQEYPSGTYENVEKAASLLTAAGHLPFLLGGDHSVTYPALRAVSARHPGLHVLHLDAHTDTYSTPLEQVFAGRSTHHHGNFAARALDALPQLAAIHQFGIRGVNNMGAVTRERQHVYWMRDTRDVLRGAKAVPLPPEAPVYLTLDIDVLEPGAAPGTATPVPGGLALRELLQLLSVLLEGRRVVGVDLVEVNPDKDRTGMTVRIALELIVFILNLLPPPAREE